MDIGNEALHTLHCHDYLEKPFPPEQMECRKDLMMYKIYTILEIACFLFCLVIFKASHMKNGIQILIVYSAAVILLYCLQKQKIAAYIKEKDRELRKCYQGDYEALLTSVRKRQHEFHNHLQAIVGMGYSVKEYDALVEMQRNYIGQLVQKNIEYQLLIADWKIFSSFFYSKINQAWKKGIGIHYNFQISKEITTIPEFIMIEIAGIILDNAMEKIEESGERALLVWMIEIEDKVCFAVANPVESFSDIDRTMILQKGYSSKKNHHGYGLCKIQEYSQDYHFSYKIMSMMLNGKEHFCFVIAL